MHAREAWHLRESLRIDLLRYLLHTSWKVVSAFAEFADASAQVFPCQEDLKVMVISVVLLKISFISSVTWCTYHITASWQCPSRWISDNVDESECPSTILFNLSHDSIKSSIDARNLYCRLRPHRLRLSFRLLQGIIIPATFAVPSWKKNLFQMSIPFQPAIQSIAHVWKWVATVCRPWFPWFARVLSNLLGAEDLFSLLENHYRRTNEMLHRPFAKWGWGIL